jgi:hypothetical protein
MSTRALYTFATAGTSDVFHVYKHHDGYPSGALRTIRTAFAWFAWELPRFEPDEAAAAFVAAGKASHLIEAYKGPAALNRHGEPTDIAAWIEYGPAAHLPGGKYRSGAGGGERLLPSGSWMGVAPGDIQFRYEINQPVGNKPVTVSGFAVSQDWSTGAWSEKKLGTVALASLMTLDADALSTLCDAWDKRAEGKLKPLPVADRAITFAEGDIPVMLSQSGPDNFTVTYGLQIEGGLNYAEACLRLGKALLHSLACADKIDNRTLSEAAEEDAEA